MELPELLLKFSFPILNHCFHCFSIYLPRGDGTGCHDLHFLNVEPTFSLSSFTIIKRLFSSSLSAIRLVSSAYLRLLIFLPAILIPCLYMLYHCLTRETFKFKKES